ncbi:MAG TPA: threonine/serine dehydratase [Thermoanaerobaculia bacterium]|nr:threonine/serine dehydratase [Thermoanaerobaculia bacterium]
MSELAKASQAQEAWPITIADVLAAQKRIRPHILPTPLRRYAPLDEAVGHRIAVWVKHENHCPTNSFKVRNALSAMSALTAEEKGRGVVAATRGNHGLGVAWAGSLLGVAVTICVPRGNNPEKNAGMRGYGAALIEEGKDYDESVVIAQRLVDERGLTLIHSTNDRRVVAGAATLTLEMLEERPELEALVMSVGGGSQAVGAMTVVRALRPEIEVFAVQAERASAAHDSWRARRRVTAESADTFADGLATRSTYELTFPALQEGLTDFLLVSEAEIAQAVRVLLSTTHNLAEGAGAAGLAGIGKLAGRLAGRNVGIVLSGGNIDARTLSRVVNGQVS